MRFDITTPVTVTPPDTYTVEVTTYRGDADGYSDFTMGPFKRGENEDSLQCLLETLRRTKERFPNGRGGSIEYSYENDVLGFVQWFGGSPCSTVEEMQEHYPKHLELFGAEVNLAISALAEDFYYEGWPTEEIYEGSFEESLDTYQVFYYDHNSVKFNVSVDWEEPAANI